MTLKCFCSKYVLLCKDVQPQQKVLLILVSYALIACILFSTYKSTLCITINISMHYQG